MSIDAFHPFSPLPWRSRNRARDDDGRVSWAWARPFHCNSAATRVIRDWGDTRSAQAVVAHEKTGFHGWPAGIISLVHLCAALLDQFQPHATIDVYLFLAKMVSE